MKKFFLIIMLAAVLMAAIACESQPDSFTVTFDPNGGSIVTGESVQTVAAGHLPRHPHPSGVITSSTAGRAAMRASPQT